MRVKTFVGTSANALKTQIWTALIAMLLLKYLQLRSRFGWSLSNLVALLRQQLFVYRDLFSWLNQPFEPPPLLEAGLQQMALAFQAPNSDSRTGNLNRTRTKTCTDSKEISLVQLPTRANLDSSVVVESTQ